MAAELWRVLPCVRTTPFGAAVEPEVYWMKATESAVTPGSLHVSAPSGPSSSLASHGTETSSGRFGARTVVSLSPGVVVSTTSGCRSATTLRSLGSVEDTLASAGEGNGAATMPAYRHPRKALTYSSPGGKSNKARSPRECRPCSAAAIVRARASSSAYEAEASRASPSARKVHTRRSGCRCAFSRRSLTHVDWIIVDRTRGAGAARSTDALPPTPCRRPLSCMEVERHEPGAGSPESLTKAVQKPSISQRDTQEGVAHRLLQTSFLPRSVQAPGTQHVAIGRSSRRR